MRIKSLFKIIIIIFLSSCSIQNTEIPINLERIPKVTAKSKDVPKGLAAETLLTTDFVMSFALNSCIGCHSGKSQPTLNTIEAVKSQLSQVINQIELGSMPKNNPVLNDCQKALVKNLAEEKIKTAGEIPACVTISPAPKILPIELMPLSFTTLDSTILRNCKFCHNPQSADLESSLIPFTSYAELVSGDNSKYWSAPGVESKVYQEITYHNAQKNNGMPPNDSGYARLTDAEVDFIVRWIDAGKPE